MNLCIDIGSRDRCVVLELIGHDIFKTITSICCFCFFFLIQAAEYVPEKVKKAEKKLEENPYDLDAWSILIREAQV